MLRSSAIPVLGIVFWTLVSCGSPESPPKAPEKGRVTGIVTESTGGAGLPGLTVRLVEANLSTTTDSQGAYTLSNLPEGVYTLVASGPGRAASQAQSVIVKDGTTTAVDLVDPEYALSATRLTPPTIAVSSGITSGVTFSPTQTDPVITVVGTAGSSPLEANASHSGYSLAASLSTGSFVSAVNGSNLVFPLPVSNLGPGSYVLTLVAYDLNNNRSILKVPFSVSALAGSPPAESPVASEYRVVGNTFGESLNFLFRSPPQGGPTTRSRDFAAPVKALAASGSTTYVTFWLLVGGDPNATGMTVERRLPSGGYQVIGRTSSTSARGSDLGYSFTDPSADLFPGSTYTYRLRYNNASGDGPASGPLSVRLLPTMTLELLAPAAGRVVTTTAPTLQWQASPCPGATLFVSPEVWGQGDETKYFATSLEDASSCVATGLVAGKSYFWTVWGYYGMQNSPNVISYSDPTPSDVANNGTWTFSVVAP